MRIVELSAHNEIKTLMRRNWLCSFAAKEMVLNQVAQLAKAEKEFEVRWVDPEWRIRCCPGKHVLRRLRDWLAADYKLSLTLNQIAQCYDPPANVRTLFDRLSAHFSKTTGQGSSADSA